MLHLHMNMNGLPLHVRKSSMLQQRPILGQIKELKTFGTFVNGLCSGTHKP